MEYQLNISGMHYDMLKVHLFPEDGKEAVAVALCGRYNDAEKHILLVHDLTLIPVQECRHREFDVVNWPTERIYHYFERVGSHNFAIVKFHSHPGGYDKFSGTDDSSDAEFFSSVFGWSASDDPHASAIMLPDGRIFGRMFSPDLKHVPINTVNVAGDIIRIYEKKTTLEKIDDTGLRTIQAFGEKTYKTLKDLTVGIVGCSGTGSVIIEQLNRLQVGKLVLVDPDSVEFKNLNRIINSAYADALNSSPKVKVLKDAIERIGFGTEVEIYQNNIYSSINALKALAKCNVIFGCVDSVDGRHLLNQFSTFYVLPYFDLGVRLDADKAGGINKICGTVHYIQPGKSSLITRGVYTTDDLRAASQYRKNPDEYQELEKNAYIKNINIDNPAVISVNMQIASHAVNEFLNRLHPYKTSPQAASAQSTIDITENCIIDVGESALEADGYLLKKVGRGDTNPFIEISEISD